MSFSSNSDTPNENNNFQVYVRIRPINSPTSKHGFGGIKDQQCQNNDNQSVIKIDKENNIIYALDLEYKNIDKKERAYAFNGIMDDQTNNDHVFKNTVQPNLNGVLHGLNATFFAYGITGSGKTHTIFGNENNPGICIRAMNFVIEQSKTMNFVVKYSFSFLEIYNENVRDLFRDDNKNLTIIEDPVKGVVVQELREYNIKNIKEIQELVERGNQKRATASTSANQYSSRSHAILQLNIESKLQDSPQVFYSKLSFIDLAGSEKVTADKQQKGIIEGANINKSLLTLGNCINILAEKKKSSNFVPYRDSKLTRLLKDTLGGNTKTVMIACISQSYSCYDETINTLNYASRATTIRKKITKNVKEEDPEIENYKHTIKMLQEELEHSKKGQNAPAYPKCSENTQRSQSPLNHDLDNDSAFMTKIKNINQQKSEINLEIQELSTQLKETYRQKIETHEETYRQKIESYLDRICNDIVTNIEEKYEINYNYKEIEINLAGSYQRLEILKQTQSQCRNSIVQGELDELLKIIKENEQIKTKMSDALEVNEKQKEILKELIIKMNEEKSNFQVDAQITIKQQQQECLELFKQNAILIKKNEEKMRQKKSIENELKQAKNTIMIKDQIIQELQQKLQHKDTQQLSPLQIVEKKRFSRIKTQVSVSPQNGQARSSIQNNIPLKYQLKDSTNLRSSPSPINKSPFKKLTFSNSAVYNKVKESKQNVYQSKVLKKEQKNKKTNSIHNPQITTIQLFSQGNKENSIKNHKSTTSLHLENKKKQSPYGSVYGGCINDTEKLTLKISFKDQNDSDFKNPLLLESDSDKKDRYQNSVFSFKCSPEKVDKYQEKKFQQMNFKKFQLSNN